MSTSSVSSSSTGLLLSSQGSGSALQITGLASGLDTNSIITQLMTIQKQPEVALQGKVSGLTAAKTQLASIQTALATLAIDAQALGNPSLFNNSTQTVTSSDPTRVSATSTNGAAVGGHEIDVSKLAYAAQRTFTYTAPASNGIMNIDNQPVNVTSGESISNFVNSINSNKNLDVYAAETDSGTVVLSNRATGAIGNTSYIAVTGAAGTLAEHAGTGRDGQDAAYSVDGVDTTSHSNTVTSAIAGVTLTLNATTTNTGAVSINVAPPGADTTGVQTAVKTFVTQYNSVIGQIQTQLAQVPSSSDPTQGALYNDPDLKSLLSTMRTAMITDGTGLATGLTNMTNLGITTGQSAGTISQSGVNGDLALNAGTLTSALQSDPNNVQALLSHFALTFSFTVNNEAAAGGVIDQRVSGDSASMSQLNGQIANMQVMLTQKQNDLTQQFAQMEAALSSNQSTASWLTSQLAQLP